MLKLCEDWKRKVAELEKRLEEEHTNLTEEHIVSSKIMAGLMNDIELLTFQRDRARMMSDSSGHLAEYRMRRIFELEAEVERLRTLHLEPSHG